MADNNRLKVRRDPWARYEAWRYTKDVNRSGNMRRMFPGFGWGIVAFLVLVGIEEMYWKPRYGSDDPGGHHW